MIWGTFRGTLHRGTFWELFGEVFSECFQVFAGIWGTFCLSLYKKRKIKRHMPPEHIDGALYVQLFYIGGGGVGVAKSSPNPGKLPKLFNSKFQKVPRKVPRKLPRKFPEILSDYFRWSKVC
jgi:hypothetical protein